MVDDDTDDATDAQTRTDGGVTRAEGPDGGAGADADGGTDHDGAVESAMAEFEAAVDDLTDALEDAIGAGDDGENALSHGVEARVYHLVKDTADDLEGLRKGALGDSLDRSNPAVREVTRTSVRTDADLAACVEAAETLGIDPVTFLEANASDLRDQVESRDVDVDAVDVLEEYEYSYPVVDDPDDAGE